MYSYDQTMNVNQNGAQQQVTQNVPLGYNMNGQTVPNVMLDEQMQPSGSEPGNMGPPPSYNGVQQTVTYDDNVVKFDIEDPIMRREFFRKVFALLLIQNIIALPIMGLFLLCFDPIDYNVYHSFWILCFLTFIPMYIFSDYRRYAPYNAICLAYTTLVVGIQEGIFATAIGTTASLISQFVVISQYLAILIYSKQTRLKFSNINAILVTIFIKAISIAVRGVFAPYLLLELRFWSTFCVIYSVYDVQLMLTGHHGYNLKAEEHIFAVSNIYADLPNLYYRILRFTVIDFFLKIYHFLKNCCFSEVC